MDEDVATETTVPDTDAGVRKPMVPPKLPHENGGVKGPEPTRYGDWEHKGRCTDF